MQLLDAQATDLVHRDLLEAVGNLAEVVGFAAYDTGNLSHADRCFRFGLWCAETSGSWSLRACVLADLARVASELGDADQALSATEFALVRSDRLPATARTMVQVMRARYLALVGRTSEARQTVDAADDVMVDRDPQSDPPWLCYYDEAEHAGAAGRALIPIAVATGQPDLVAPRLSAAINGQRSQYPRSKVFSRLRLANLLVTLDEPEQGAAVGVDALQDAGRLQSHRVAAELGQLQRASRPYATVPAIAELCDQITGHLRDLDPAGVT
jgi:hypothetical protein